MKYRKKPVVIEAMKYEGGILGFDKAYAFVGESLLPYLMNPGDADTLHIKTLEGLMAVSKGDYIIKGISGEFYPCKPDIFEATYEVVEEGRAGRASRLTVRFQDFEKLIETEEKLKEAMQVVDFYANKSLWSLTGSIRNIRVMSTLEGWVGGLSDLEEFEVKNTMGYLEDGPILIYKIGGRRAREFQNKIRKERK